MPRQCTRTRPSGGTSPSPARSRGAGRSVRRAARRDVKARARRGDSAGPRPYPPARAVWIGSGTFSSISHATVVLSRYFIARYERSPSMPPAMAYGRFGLPRHDPRLAHELGRVLVRLGQRDLLAGTAAPDQSYRTVPPVCRSRPRCTSPMLPRACGLTSSNRPAIASAPFMAAFCFVICHLFPDAEPGRLVSPGSSWLSGPGSSPPSASALCSRRVSVPDRRANSSQETRKACSCLNAAP